MEKNRLEAFSDGVLAIVITIMVLEMKVPKAVEEVSHVANLTDLKPVLPVFLSYVLSFVYIGIYWNNHHHMLHATRHVTGGILWANLHLLFWLSLFPFTTAWAGENHGAPTPIAVYGFALLMAAIAYYILERAIIRHQGQNSILARAVGNRRKEYLSPLCYLAGIPLAYLNVGISIGLYVFVAVLWLVPDRRIERMVNEMR
jgi:TMEM175 potassium channel family protein